MTTLIPTSSACHLLQLPVTEKDDRLNLNVRTGSASVLHNSLVFTYGGLTIGLDLDFVTIQEISDMFLLKIGKNKSRKIRKYLSGELFYLELIAKCWTRVILPPLAPRPKARLFHELAKGNNCIYLFGGLTVPDELEDLNDICELVPCNDLWEFNLSSKSWTFLHDGSNWRTDKSVPRPRYYHKMTLVNSLPFAGKKDHFGLLIAGGQDEHSNVLYDNVVFDLVDKTYVDSGNPVVFSASSGDAQKDDASGLSYYEARDENKNIAVNYLNSIIVNFTEEVEYHHHSHLIQGPVIQNKSTVEEESIIIYSPTKELPNQQTLNPLLTFRIGRKLGRGKVMPLHRKKRVKGEKEGDVLHQTIPHNLRYPTGGLFGQNLVITGFLPNDFDISIFIYNKPTGKWSRLNIFCLHDYGSHRFWGGFAWTSHHKVVLLGNYVTSRTTSSVRYFSSMITVSLPVTNILASFELAGSHINPEGKKFHFNENGSDDLSTLSSTDEESNSSLLQLSDIDDEELPETHPMRKFSNMSAKSDIKNGQHTISFSEYVHYAAPKVNFTRIRSVFPPAAITLGRNAFDRYGDLISDFELISTNGDRIPVSLTILKERWGTYFIDLLAKAYVKAIDKFETDQTQGENQNNLRSSKSSGSESVGSRCVKMSSPGSENSHIDHARSAGEKGTFHVSMPLSKPSQKEAPQFRLPFQDTGSVTSFGSKEGSAPPIASLDPHKQVAERKNSLSSYSSAASMLTSHLHDLPPQLPLPSEPIPAVPATPLSFRSSSRKNSTDTTSPRASLIHTLTILRSIPSSTNKSPRGSPFASPRNSVSEPQSIPEMIFSKPATLPISESLPGSDSDGDKKSVVSARNPSVTSLGSGKKTNLSSVLSETVSENTTPSSGKVSPSEIDQERDSDTFSHALLNFENMDAATFKMEPSLIPRKLYIPFCTSTLKAFAEYLYTGEVGNKWSLRPCALDCLLMARYFRVPHLYDLISEVLYGIIGRKEAHVIKEGSKLKKKYMALFEGAHAPPVAFTFPLDEYEGFMDTVDDGYLDVALLRKSSSLHNGSVSTLGSKKKQSTSLGMSISEEPTTFGEQGYFRSKSKHSLAEEPRSPKSVNVDDDELSRDSPEEKSDEGGDGVALELHYLDYNERKSIPGPRSKSVFDRSIHGSISPFGPEDIEDEKGKALMTTLESLVSPDSPAPSDFVIELIYEASSMCTDVKMMLRSLNARHMGRALLQAQEEYEKLVAIYKSGDPPLHSSTFSDDPSMTPQPSLGAAMGTSSSTATKKSVASLTRTHGLVGTASTGGSNAEAEKPALQPTLSSVSLLTIHTSKSASDISRTTTNFKFAPFAMSDSRATTKGSLENNKEVDKRIAKLIKKDERLKQKAAKEDRVKLHELKKLEKKMLQAKKGKQDDWDDAGSVFSKGAPSISASLTEHTSPAPGRHGFLHRLGNRIKSEAVAVEAGVADLAQVSRTKSTVSLASSSSKSSKKSSGKVKSGLFGLKKKST